MLVSLSLSHRAVLVHCSTVYATLGIDAVVDVVTDNHVPLLVCNRKDVGKLVLKLGKMKCLTHIVYSNDLCAPEDLAAPLPTSKHVKIVSFEEFVASGDTAAYPPTPPTPQTVAIAMATSGSTGKPKSVIINHAQVTAVVGAADIALGIEKGKDVYLAYLPLAHIMELMAEFVMVSACSLS